MGAQTALARDRRRTLSRTHLRLTRQLPSVDSWRRCVLGTLGTEGPHAQPHGPRPAPTSSSPLALLESWQAQVQGKKGKSQRTLLAGSVGCCVA